MVVAVLGYGLIGQERVKALLQLQREGFPVARIIVFDPALGHQPIQAGKVDSAGSLEDVARARPDWVIIATPHDAAAALAVQVSGWGVRVLVEKPLGRSLEEARRIAACAQFPGQLSVGFNYRFYPGIRRAILDAQSGRFGRLINVSMTLGHGGAPGMEQTWKLDPVRAGGGCLIDPGVHLLDLCLLLAQPRLAVAAATKWEGFWNTGIEEEVHLLLKSGETVFNLQISIVRWRSSFRLEIHGVDGYGIVTGRGRSYGQQRYMFGERWAWQTGKPQAGTESLVCESDGAQTFRDELAALFDPVSGALPPCSAKEALDVMELLDECRVKLDSPCQCRVN